MSLARNVFSPTLTLPEPGWKYHEKQADGSLKRRIGNCSRTSTAAHSTSFLRQTRYNVETATKSLGGKINVSALPQHDQRVTCVSCRFSYPQVRGYCPMCGTPTPPAEESAPGPRPVEAKNLDDAKAPRMLAFMGRRGGKSLVLAAALLVVAFVLFFVRGRGVHSPVKMAPVLTSPTVPSQPGPPSPPAPEVVAGQPQPLPAKPATPISRAAAAVPTSTDPVELWKRVRKGDVDAEVSLARLYLDGSGVAQNCEQAHLLLSAAAKKRSRAADQVLSSLYPQRCP